MNSHTQEFIVDAIDACLIEPTGDPNRGVHSVVCPL
jgi:hypothetical protein